MSTNSDGKSLRYSVSLVTQGKHQFYTFTMPSDVLANTCFVSTRDEDPKHGFQRVLDKDRARQIAEYIDTGLGTIPSAIVLSAQPDAELKIVGGGKTIEFKNTPRAFLVLDGQHRVFGFSLAKTSLRVPVVVYNNLTRKDESKLFIDINTKQRPVPNELLLDIKNLAEYENDIEQLLREIFDYFNSEPDSPLLGLLSPTAKARGKLTRVTFNAALKPLVTTFAGSTGQEIYEAVSNYLTAFIANANRVGASEVITSPIVFRAVMLLFVEVGQRVQDRYGKAYTADNFAEVLSPIFSRVKAATLKKPGDSYKELHGVLVNGLKTFTL